MLPKDKKMSNKNSTQSSGHEQDLNEDQSEEDKLLSDFTRFYLLVLLYEKPMHGYGLKQIYEERLKKPISYSLIYTFLTKLQKKGYLVLRVEMIGQKEKKIYTFSDQGKKFAEKMFYRFSGIMDTAIEPNIQICAGCGIKLYKNSYQEMIEGKKLNFCCRHCAHAYKTGSFHEH